MCRPCRGTGDGFTRPFQKAASVAKAFFGDLVDAFSIGEVRRVNQSSNSSSTLGFAQVESEGARVGQDVAADWFGGVAPHGIWLGVHLVGDQHEGVVHIGEFLEVLQVAVEFLLSACEHTSSNELRSEVAGEGIDDDHLHVQSLAHALDLIGQEHLVS